MDPRRAHPPQQLGLTRLFAPKIEQPLFFPAEMDSGADWFHDWGTSVLRAEAARDSSMVSHSRGSQYQYGAYTDPKVRICEHLPYSYMDPVRI